MTTPEHFPLNLEERLDQCADNEPGEYEVIDLLDEASVTESLDPDVLRLMNDHGFDQAVYALRGHDSGYAVYASRDVPGLSSEGHDAKIELCIESDGECTVRFLGANDYEIHSEAFSESVWQTLEHWQIAVDQHFQAIQPANS